jgi:hypothetical protein
MYGPDTAGWDESDRAERSADELKRIARYQRWVIAMLLMQLAVWGGYVALLILRDGRRLSGEVPMTLTVISGVVGAVFVFLLTWELKGAFGAIAFGFTAPVPGFGLAIMGMVHGHATRELRRHGITVGLFGATVADIDRRPSLYDDEDAGW